MKRAAVGAAALVAAAGLPLAAAVPASAVTVYAVTATIPVGTGPAGVAVDPVTGNVYVADNGAASVSEILPNNIVATIPAGASPVGVAIDGGTIFVANSGDGTVSEISGSGQLVGSVTVGLPSAALYGLAANPNTRTLYVTGNGFGFVNTIDESSLIVTGGFAVGNNPTGIAVDPSTGNIYVANNGDGTVSVINPATNTPIATIPVGPSPYGVAVDPANNSVYVAGYGSNSVSVISEATNTVTATIPVGNKPVGVAANPATGTVYVTNLASNNVSVIDDTTNTVTATVPVGNGPYGIAANIATGQVYVANSASNTVSVIKPRVAVSTNGSVTANATVNQAVSLSGLSGTITFPAANPGTAATAIGAEAYTVSTNDPAGYDLTLTASGAALVSSGGSIPNTDLTVKETAAAPGPQTFGPGAGAALTLANTNAPSSDSYSEDWTLAIPSTAPASTYTESFVYLVLGN